MKLKSMLSKNGKIIVSTGFVPNNLSNWWYLRDSTHISFFKESSIKMLACKLDMHVVINDKENIFVLMNK